MSPRLLNAIVRGGGGVLSLLTALIIASCDDSGQKLSKNPAVEDLSNAEAHQYLGEVAQSLALKDPVTGLAKPVSGEPALLKSSFLNRLVKEEVLPISEALDDAVENIRVEGRSFQVRVEIFNARQAEATAKKTSFADGDLYGVYPDPANYYDGKSDHVDFPVNVVFLENGEYKTREEIWTAPYAADIDEIDDVFSQYIRNLRETTQYPLFAVTMENADSDPQDKPSLGKQSYYGYLGIEGIYLKVTRDGLTSEEFEMWWSDPALPGTMALRDMFNGNKHYDARGQNLKFPDVNTDGKWYNVGDEFPTTIGLIGLDNTALVMAPWEDDWYSGEMDRFARVTDILDPVLGIFGTKVYRDAYNAETNTVVDDVTFTYRFNTRDLYGVIDEDDPYAEAGFYAITSASISARTGGGSQFWETSSASNKKLDDINIRFTQVY